MTEYQMGYYDGCKEMKAQIEAKYKRRWISVEDECPDYKLQVLAITYEDMRCMGEIKPCTTVHVAYTRGKDEGWFDWYSNKWLDVTHWLPMTALPELPKEG